jgi:hypothetical protein
MEGINSTTDSQVDCSGSGKEWNPNSCQPTGSNLTVSTTHSGSDHHSSAEAEYIESQVAAAAAAR